VANRTSAEWAEIVERIKTGDPEAAGILYQDLETGARFFLRRHLNNSADVDDKIHDLYLIVVEAIRRGELRESDRLMGFVRTILYRQLNLEISLIVRKRETSTDVSTISTLAASEPTPEDDLATQEKVGLLRQLLGEMRSKDREVLMRFYMEEQSPERIQREMSLSKRQFDLLKTRAKARLQKAVQGRMVMAGGAVSQRL
jgi:RNA polymerase sigma-70 factor, ECF subfamily